MLKNSIVKIINIPQVAFFRYIYSKFKIFVLTKTRKNISIELGSGNKKGKDNWITIDTVRGCDIYFDLRKGIPFPKESVSKIYSSHLFEHLSFTEGQKLLDECKRVLVFGGVFSICVPDARRYIDSYALSTNLKRDNFSYNPAYNNTTLIDHVNYIAYMDGHHKYMFDKENLLHILEKKGFGFVHLREFDPGIDSKNRDYESIYAECIK